jgi:predicted RNA-binding Zn-ribbon protein involved in translation (DUF1610 family)
MNSIRECSSCRTPLSDTAILRNVCDMCGKKIRATFRPASVHYESREQDSGGEILGAWMVLLSGLSLAYLIFFYAPTLDGHIYNLERGNMRECLMIVAVAAFIGGLLIYFFNRKSR